MASQNLWCQTCILSFIVLQFALCKNLCGNHVPSLSGYIWVLGGARSAQVLEICCCGAEVMEDRRSTKIPRPPGALRPLTSNVCSLHG